MSAPLLTPLVPDVVAPPAVTTQARPTETAGAQPTLSSKPMRLLVVEFDELYARHLRRHSQFGINVAHLLALFGVWYAVYGLLYWTIGINWSLTIPAALYLAALAPNVPLRVLAATTVYLALIAAAVLLVPQPPFWVFLILIPVCYKLQSWSHKFYTISLDMTEFNKKYRKGSALFVVLLLYEVPILLRYLFFPPSRRG
jgi:hypothetical protein